ncbi:MAG: helix-turn-helix domain-containing protein [Sphingomonas taxi]
MEFRGVPHFYLYGEPHRAATEGFIHVEALDDRSRPSEWTIRAHAHADLVQLFVVAVGGGAMQADERELHFAAPAVLIVPAGVVHGFVWASDSAGMVMTMAQSYLAAMVDRHPDFGRIFAAPRAMQPGGETVAAMRTQLDILQRELGWSARGHHAAIEGALLSLLVTTLRGIAPETIDTRRPQGQQAAMVARYRERIGARFRLRESVAIHATALGVSESSLRAACRRIAGRSPAAMIDERAFLEAQRALLYTNISVAEIGYALGFADPAYFTRFFTRHAGQSPRRFRNAPAERRDRGRDGS